MYYYDYSYLLFILPALLLSLWAQALVKSRFSKYDKVICKKNITGSQAAAYLLRANGITDVKISHINGQLTDNYNPSTKILSLSDSTFNSNSIAAIGVAAHETGHAIQHAKNYWPLNFRRTLVPVANLGSRFGPILVLVGLGIQVGTTVSEKSGYVSIAELITLIGICLFSLSVLFYLITLPVEFNASNRALKILEKANVMDKDELYGTKKVLGAAAMTYVASALTALGHLFRLLVISNSNRRRR